MYFVQVNSSKARDLLHSKVCLHYSLSNMTKNSKTSMDLSAKRGGEHTIIWSPPQKKKSLSHPKNELNPQLPALMMIGSFYCLKHTDSICAYTQCLLNHSRSQDTTDAIQRRSQDNTGTIQSFTLVP